LRPLPLSGHLPRPWNRFWHWLSDRALFDPMVRRETDAFRLELELEPIRESFAAWSLSRSRIVGRFPEWFAPIAEGWPAQTRLAGFPIDGPGVGPPLAPEFERFLEAGEPPVVFTPGSAMRHARHFFAEGVAACRRLGLRCVLVSPHRDQIPGRLPPSVRSIDEAPFGLLFGRAAAVVHHGGIGTLAQGLRAGVPQLVMPMILDQHDNAARLRRLGLSEWLPPRRFLDRAVARKLRWLLDSPAVASACRATRDRFDRENRWEDALGWIEEAAGEPR
jgi:rhamnosyltransferase subunit B